MEWEGTAKKCNLSLEFSKRTGTILDNRCKHWPSMTTIDSTSPGDWLTLLWKKWEATNRNLSSSLVIIRIKTSIIIKIVKWRRKWVSTGWFKTWRRNAANKSLICTSTLWLEFLGTSEPTWLKSNIGHWKKQTRKSLNWFQWMRMLKFWHMQVSKTIVIQLLWEMWILVELMNAWKLWVNTMKQINSIHSKLR